MSLSKALHVSNLFKLNRFGLITQQMRHVKQVNVAFKMPQLKSIKMSDRQYKNLNSRENFYSSEVAKQGDLNATSGQQQSLSIFKRFKEAYKQHGKVLIYCHLTTCVGWIVGLFCLSESGYDITKILNLVEKMSIISEETKLSFIKKIENFSLVDFLKKLHFDYILSEETLNAAGQMVTGNTLKHMITAVVLYKLFTPLRYLLTLTLTKLLINVFKSKGIIPKQPPVGYSIKDIYIEKKLLYQKRLINQKERYLKSKQSFKLGLVKSGRIYFLKKKPK